MTNTKSGGKSGSQSQKLKQAGTEARSRSNQDRTSGKQSCPLQDNAFIEIKLVDLDNQPLAGQACVITDQGGTVHPCKTTTKGLVRVEGIPEGQCQVKFPDLDQDSVDLTTNVKPQQPRKPAKKPIPKKSSA